MVCRQGEGRKKKRVKTGSRVYLAGPLPARREGEDGSLRAPENLTARGLSLGIRVGKEVKIK